MLSELDRLQRAANNTLEKANTTLNENFSNIETHLTAVRDEYLRVAEFSGQAGYVIDEIDRDFQKKTKLNGTDVILLFLCTALQCARQYLLNGKMMRFNPTKNEAGRVIQSSSQKGDQFMKNTVGGTLDFVKPEWNEIIFQSVPYDAIKTGEHISTSTGLSGTTHRYRTLGHDPVLGWIFGTANIMTNSLTKFNFETFQVKNMVIIRHYPLGVVGMMDRAANYAQSDPKLLAASVVRQAIHFGSDMFTTQGLPIPLVMTVNNNLAKDMLTKWHIDTWSVSRNAGLAILINQLIFCIHQLFYNESRDGSYSMYEVRTRKILSYSNLLATGSNIIVVALTKDISKLDIGGMLVTIYRLVSDYKFIHEVKRDFLKQELYKRVVGDPYDFMRER